MSTTNIMEGETSPSEALKIIKAHLVRPLFFLLRGLSTKKRCRKVKQTNKQTPVSFLRALGSQKSICYQESLR